MRTHIATSWSVVLENKFWMQREQQKDCCGAHHDDCRETFPVIGVQFELI